MKEEYSSISVPGTGIYLEREKKKKYPEMAFGEESSEVWSVFQWYTEEHEEVKGPSTLKKGNVAISRNRQRFVLRPAGLMPIEICRVVINSEVDNIPTDPDPVF